MPLVPIRSAQIPDRAVHIATAASGLSLMVSNAAATVGTADQRWNATDILNRAFTGADTMIPHQIIGASAGSVGPLGTHLSVRAAWAGATSISDLSVGVLGRLPGRSSQWPGIDTRDGGMVGDMTIPGVSTLANLDSGEGVWVRLTDATGSSIVSLATAAGRDSVVVNNSITMRLGLPVEFLLRGCDAVIVVVAVAAGAGPTTSAVVANIVN